MPADNASCPLCERTRDHAAALRIAALRESVVFLHEHQAYLGWCVVVLKDHAEHLGGLPVARQLRLWEDVAQVAAAVQRAFTPARINYECLGNVIGHVHWHVIPRYGAAGSTGFQPVVQHHGQDGRGTDPDPRSTVWTRPAAERDCGVTAELAAELIGRLRKAGLPDM